MSKLITVKASGDFKKTMKFLQAIKEKVIYKTLDSYGKQGVEILQAATPKKTGRTASSWSYVVNISDGEVSLEWHNNSMANDGKTPVVVLIINGHGTRTGGYVPPNDFVTPAMEALLDEATEAVWKAVNSL